MSKVKIFNQELLDWSKEYDGNKFGAILADPPYLISWMNSSYDTFTDRKQAIETTKSWGESVSQHLLPGAVVIMFSAPRSQHYLVMGMEEAGFTTRDVIMYCFGTGFPKGQDISRMVLDNTGDSELSSKWSGYKTISLKSSYEPAIIFQWNPSKLSYAELAVKYGTGCLNIDGTRIPIGENLDFSRVQRQQAGTAGMSAIGGSGYKVGHVQPLWNSEGRYPANIILDETTAIELDEQSGISSSTRCKNPSDCGGETWGSFQTNRPPRGYDDEGGASRFFFTTKSSMAEREAGLDDFEPKQVGDGRKKASDTAHQRGSTLRRNTHNAVKPIDVDKYLATLMLPPPHIFPRRLLNVFSGSGSEAIGAMLAGWDEIVGVEREKEYYDISLARVKWWENAMIQKNSNDVDVLLDLAKSDKKVKEEGFSLI